jgi:chemotaxis protein CheD
VQIVVNVSDAKASADPADSIITYSLGSCIGVMLHEASAKVGGMLHFQLPTSTMDEARARQNPMMFADSGFEVLMQMMVRLGANPRRIKARIAGGAKMLNDSSTFDIGRRNHQAIRKVLWRHGMFLEKEDCGGSSPRTVTLTVGDGAVSVKSAGTVTTL